MLRINIGRLNNFSYTKKYTNAPNPPMISQHCQFKLLYHFIRCLECLYHLSLTLLGGLAEEVTEKTLHAAFIPFGDIMDIQIPLDYETEKHRGFAFVEFEFAEVKHPVSQFLRCFLVSFYSKILFSV